MKNMSAPAVLDAVGCMLRCVCSEGRGTDSSLDSNSSGVRLELAQSHSRSSEIELVLKVETRSKLKQEV